MQKACYNFEVEQPMNDEPPTKCQSCDSDLERLIGLPTIFCKDPPHSPYQKDFRSDPHKRESVCESASGAGKKDKEEIRRNWNNKQNRWV